MFGWLIGWPALLRFYYLYGTQTILTGTRSRCNAMHEHTRAVRRTPGRNNARNPRSSSPTTSLTRKQITAHESVQQEHPFGDVADDPSDAFEKAVARCRAAWLHGLQSRSHTPHHENGQSPTDENNNNNNNNNSNNSNNNTTTSNNNTTTSPPPPPPNTNNATATTNTNNNTTHLDAGSAERRRRGES